MRAGQALPIAILLVFTFLVGGCRRSSPAKPISLAQFGGKLKLRLDLRKGDRFAYEEVKRISVSGRSNREATITNKSEMEVLDCRRNQVEAACRLVDVKVETKDESMAQRLRRSQAKLLDVRVECVCNSVGKVMKVTAASSDPAARQAAEAKYGKSAGLQGFILPEDSVGIGAEWQGSLGFAPALSVFGVRSERAGATSAPINFRLIGAEEADGRTLAIVEYEIQFSYKPSPSESAFGQKPKLESFTSKVSGTARFDITTGILVGDTEATSDVTVVGGQRIEVTSQSTTRLTERP